MHHVFHLCKMYGYVVCMLGVCVHGCAQWCAKLFISGMCLSTHIFFFVWQMHYPLWMTALVGFLPETMQSYQCELHEMGYSLSF